ncbi:MAG: FGGY-family carbohydrate kinase [Propionibacteriaceae bacterium]|nr:FGGY-family carbohydrate kinase [Propionibacteriaceae bacterium]
MKQDHYLGIEFGSTRIKAVLIDSDHQVVAAGSHTWENHFDQGIWTYGLNEVWEGLSQAYGELKQTYVADNGEPPVISAIGVSAMMHGYLVFDDTGAQLAQFRTWRNTMTLEASAVLTTKLRFTIPQRWTIAHLYQAVLNHEDHVSSIDHITTLAGYVHWKLTGEKVLGVGDASGVFPIDETHSWDRPRMDLAQELLDEHDAGIQLSTILPEVRVAGQPAGTLTTSGARLIDPSGDLPDGIVVVPPEGDAGTGMVATHAVAPRTGNISAGTSIFAMIVLERELTALHPEIDMVTTPAGDPVAMVHCNNGASELDAWAGVFTQFASRAQMPLESTQVFSTLFHAGLDGDKDGGGLLAYNYLAGEPITGLTGGRPLIVRTPESSLTLENLMRTLLMSSFATLSLGMRILESEQVELDTMRAHGGIFTTKTVAQSILAAAMNTPVSVGATASEGGAWGMAILAAYGADTQGLSLGDYLTQVVFAHTEIETLEPDPGDVAGYQQFLQHYERSLPLMAVALETTTGES